MASPPPPGIYVPVPTFFSKPPPKEPTPPLDLETQTEHALHLAKNGIRGLVLLGSTGEAIALTNEDRKSLIAHIRQELDRAGYKDYPLIAGTATQGIEDTVKQLQFSKEAGAQWGLVLAPGFFATVVTQQGIIDWYTAVADHSPLPILIYHYPAVSNNISLTASTFTTLSAHPNICGAKLSHGDLSLHAQLALSKVFSMSHDHFATFTGLGQQLLPVLMVGGAGAIDGLAAIFPRTVVRLYDLIKDGKWEEARQLQEIVARGEGLVVGHGVVGAKEGIRRVLGWDSECRLPLRKGMSDEAWKQWEGVVSELEEAEKS
ncbi:MAG: hypothetical protein LQ346_006398 [Caloplaca aetnensis]|nr:MAG: hypothetical protein LQ346_006398 [Caloplaca aetnensis]